MSLSSVDMSTLLQTLSQNGLRIEQLTITATYGKLEQPITITFPADVVQAYTVTIENETAAADKTTMKTVRANVFNAVHVATNARTEQKERARQERDARDGQASSAPAGTPDAALRSEM